MGIKDIMLCYHGGGLSLLAYSGSSFSNDPDNGKSTSGYVFLLGRGVISWSSQKQHCAIMLTTEAKYVACPLVAMEAVWIRCFLLDLGLVSIACDPIPLRTNSTTSICLAKEPQLHQRAKHIKRKQHFIREQVEVKEIAISHVPSLEMIANPMTKPLMRELFVIHVRRMGMQYM